MPLLSPLTYNGLEEHWDNDPLKNDWEAELIDSRKQNASSRTLETEAKRLRACVQELRVLNKDRNKSELIPIAEEKNTRQQPVRVAWTLPDEYSSDDDSDEDDSIDWDTLADEHYKVDRQHVEDLEYYPAQGLLHVKADADEV
eukprot:1179024-Prorocentrum_minimum.AAC.3